MAKTIRVNGKRILAEMERQGITIDMLSQEIGVKSIELQDMINNDILWSFASGRIYKKLGMDRLKLINKYK